MGHHPRHQHDRADARRLRAPAEPRADEPRPTAGGRCAHAPPRPRGPGARPQSRRVLARSVRAGLLAARHRVRGRVHRHLRVAARARGPRRVRGALRRRVPRPDRAVGPAAGRRRPDRPGPGVGGGPRRLPGAAAAPAGHAQRARGRAPVHRTQHPHDPPGVRARPHRRARIPRRRDPGRAGARAQLGDDQEHPPVGLPPSPAHVRAAPGDPDLLQVHGRGQRPLCRERRVPPAHAVAARALVPAPPVPDLDQRAPDVHPRLRRRGRARQPHHRRRAAGVPGQGHPAPVDGRLPEDHATADLLRRGLERVRPGEDEVAGARLSLGRPERLHDLHRRRRHPALVVPPQGPVRRAVR